MRTRFLGLSCAGLALLCVGLGSIAAFFGAILVGQSVQDVTFPISTATVTIPAFPIVKATRVQVTNVPDEPMGVTLVAPDTPLPQDIETATTSSLSLPASITATPSANPTMLGDPLGTLGYPLTVTAQARVQSTQINAYRGSIDATRTAAALRVIPTHLALTLTASAGK